MYHGARPWHGLGTALDHPATAAEAILAAGLDWRVELISVWAAGKPIPRSYGVVRMDRREPIAVVGKRYVPLQNREAFEFFDHLIGEGHAVYETAGSLDQGRRIWLLARLPGEVWVTKEDNVGKYLLLTNSHDGKSPLRALFTPIRVVCENTLRVALGGQASGISIRHEGDVLAKAKQAQRVLGISLKYFDSFGEQAETFVKFQLTERKLDEYFLKLVPDPVFRDDGPAMDTRNILHELFESGKGNALPTVRGTLWAAVNAVAEFSDHVRATRVQQGGSEVQNRFKSAQFGSGAALKERAWSLAMALLG